MKTWICRKLCVSQCGVFFSFMKNFSMALLSFIFALGGTIKAITSFSRGFGVGLISGAITGIQLMELIANGEPFSKVEVMQSLVNGNLFTECVRRALLKAYHWQVRGMATSLMHLSDVNSFDGLSHDAIKVLPVHEFCDTETTPPFFKTSCAICLLDLKDGEYARLLPSCKHIFMARPPREMPNMQKTCSMKLKMIFKKIQFVENVRSSLYTA